MAGRRWFKGRCCSLLRMSFTCTPHCAASWQHRSYFCIEPPRGGKLRCLGKPQGVKPELKACDLVPGPQKSYTAPREGVPCQFACFKIPNSSIHALFPPNRQDYNSFRNGVLKCDLPPNGSSLPGRNCMVDEIFPSVPTCLWKTYPGFAPAVIPCSAMSD